jgi:hypothetical protein
MVQPQRGHGKGAPEGKIFNDLKTSNKGKESNMIESQKGDAESELTITKLKKELAIRERQLGITKQEGVVQRVKEKQGKLRVDVERMFKSGKSDEGLERRLRESNEELWLEEKKLEGLRSNLDEKGEALKMALSAKRREFAESEASRAWSKIEALKKELCAQVQRLVCFGIIWERNCPVRVSRFTSKLVLIRKKATVLPDGSLNPPGQARDGDGYIVKEIPLHELAKLRDGWEAVPGQNLELDPANPGNSRSIKTLEPPPVISKIQNLDIEIDDSNVWTAQGDADAMVKAIEREIDEGNERAS